MLERRVFLLLGFIIFLTMTGYGIVLPTLPFVADRLNLTSFQMGTLITGWAVAQLATAPFWGRLTDTWGRKHVLLSGLFGFAVAFFLLVFAQSYWQLLFARVIGAVLSSGTLPAVIALVSDLTDLKHRNVAIAKIGAINGLGFLCGPAVGGLFAPLGVNVPFIVAGICAFITLPIAMRFLFEPEAKTTLKRDQATVFKSLTMVTRKGYWQFFIVTFGVSMAASSFFGLLGYFMIERFNASPVIVSLAFSTQAGVSVIVQFFFLEKFYQWFEEESLAKFGLLSITLGFSFIAFSPHASIAIIGCLLTGFGQACVNPTILSILSKRETYGQGITIGMHQAMNSLGRIVGPLLGGAIFSILISGPFLTSAVIALLLFFIVLLSSHKETADVDLIKKEKGSHV